ncbi:MAG TPA: hemolysin family protein [Polyangia bacterium]|jgi:CBS domain containing-hemolysin-like protein|nr:hemolysin family protein [Polyangia bacterium]
MLAHAPDWLQHMWPAFVVTGFCLLLEMFFAAAELSVISCDRILLRKDAEANQRAALLLERFLENKQRFLATTLLGTQMSVIVSTVTMTYALHRIVSPERAELFLLAGLTPLLVIFGEIVPKTIGQHAADRWARRLVYPLYGASKLFAAIVTPLTALTTAIMRRMGVVERKLVTREELEALLKTPSVSSKRGEITEGERRMISRIFDFTDTTAADVMVPLSDVVALAETADLATAARQIEETQYTRFPVYRERVDRIVGTVHAFDILKAGRSDAKIGALARAPIFVPGNQPAVDLLVELQRARQGMAIIVDEYGGAVGIAAIEDILEEIVGEINDEHDVAAPKIRKEAEGVWRVNARTSVTEVNRQLKLELPEGEEYESIGGLVLEKLRHIPREGESVRFGGLLVKVVKANERAVEEVPVRQGKRRSPTRGPGTIG